MIRRPPRSALFPDTTLFQSADRRLLRGARAGGERPRGVAARLAAGAPRPRLPRARPPHRRPGAARSEEHTSELQSRPYIVCRLLLVKKLRLVVHAPPPVAAR